MYICISIASRHFEIAPNFFSFLFFIKEHPWYEVSFCLHSEDYTVFILTWLLYFLFSFRYLWFWENIHKISSLISKFLRFRKNMQDHFCSFNQFLANGSEVPRGSIIVENSMLCRRNPDKIIRALVIDFHTSLRARRSGANYAECIYIHIRTHVALYLALSGIKWFVYDSSQRTAGFTNEDFSFILSAFLSSDEKWKTSFYSKKLSKRLKGCWSDDRNLIKVNSVQTFF